MHHVHVERSRPSRNSTMQRHFADCCGDPVTSRLAAIVVQACVLSKEEQLKRYAAKPATLVRSFQWCSRVHSRFLDGR